MDIMKHFVKKPEEGAKSTQEPENQEAKAAAESTETVTEEAEETLSQDKGTTEESADPYATWTKDDYIKEMKASREEAAKARVEKKELEKSLTENLNKQLSELEKKFTPFIEQVKEAKKREDIEKDAKRSLEEKVSDRDTRLKAIADEKQAIEDSFKSKIVELESKLEKVSTDVKTYESIYQKELDKELAEVPQKSRYLADMIVKAADGNIQDALLAIRQAKTDGAFGSKKVQVYNATPGATNGGRMSAASAQPDPDKMTKNQKLEKGLSEFKSKERRKNMLD